MLQHIYLRLGHCAIHHVYTKLSQEHRCVPLVKRRLSEGYVSQDHWRLDQVQRSLGETVQELWNTKEEFAAT